MENASLIGLNNNSTYDEIEETPIKNDESLKKKGKGDGKILRTK